MGTRDPAGAESTLCALGALALQRPSPGGAKAPFLGTPPPRAKGYLQPGAGAALGPGAQAPALGGKLSHGERRAVLATTARLLAEGPALPARAADFVCLLLQGHPHAGMWNLTTLAPAIFTFRPP